MPQHLMTLLLILGVAAFAAGCNTTGRPLPELVSEINGTLYHGESLLPGDELEVRFPYESDWDQKTKISERGAASFLGLDELNVGGMTVGDLDGMLTKKYEDILDTPDLTVRVVARAPRTCSILGEVRKAGNYSIRNHYTLLDLFSDANGVIRSSADLRAVLLLRWVPTIQQARVWYIDAREHHWNHQEPLYIQPLDVVYIPNTPIDQVNIWVDKYVRKMLPFPASAVTVP